MSQPLTNDQLLERKMALDVLLVAAKIRGIDIDKPIFSFDIETCSNDSDVKPAILPVKESQFIGVDEKLDSMSDNKDHVSVTMKHVRSKIEYYLANPL